MKKLKEFCQNTQETNDVYLLCESSTGNGNYFIKL